MFSVRSTLLYLLVLATAITNSESHQFSPYLDVYPSTNSIKNASVPLYFGLMLALNGDHQRLSSGALAGVRAALDEINSRDDLFLPGYSLHYTLTDSKVKLNVKTKS